MLGTHRHPAVSHRIRFLTFRTHHLGGDLLDLRSLITLQSNNRTEPNSIRHFCQNIQQS